MARWARVVVPDVAHHVMQRGHRRQETFFDEEDYATYLGLLSEWCAGPSEAASQNDWRNKYGVPNGGPLSSMVAFSYDSCRFSAWMTEIACKYRFSSPFAMGAPGTDLNARSHRCGYCLCSHSLTDRHSMVSPEFPKSGVR